VPNELFQVTWMSAAAAAAGALLLMFLVLVVKNRHLPEGEVFVASRWTRGNHLFPTQVAITPESVIQRKPQWLGRREESIHIDHVASVKTDTGLLFSEVVIETSGGSEPIVCHGHSNADATRMKEIIEHNQTASAAGKAAPDAGGPTRVCPFCAEAIQGAATVCRYCGRDVAKTA
jgi:hypothetical protein